MANALQWILEQNGIQAVLHYLDDFLIIGTPHPEDCKWALEATLLLCKLLDVPVAAHKTEGPGGVLVF